MVKPIFQQKLLREINNISLRFGIKLGKKQIKNSQHNIGEDMKQIPIKDEKIPAFNKKSVGFIGGLVIAGIITGLILSAVFVTEANDRIREFNDQFGQEWPSGTINQIPPSITEGNGFITVTQIQPLTTEDIVFPTLGVIIVCISVFLLIGLIAVYIKIFMKTKSRYVTGLLFFLAPLLLQSIYSVNVLRSLFFSAFIPFGGIGESVGFGFGGLGSILVIVSLFEIFGLSILLYLSNE